MNRPQYGKIALFESAKERTRLEELADLFAIIRTTDSLEAAFSRDAITPEDYADACKRLISQFKTQVQAMQSARPPTITSAESFFQEYEIDCSRAFERLVKDGVPATVVHATNDARTESVTVAQTTQAFITAMDALKLEQRAVDQIQPLVSDLMGSLGRVNGIKIEEEFGKIRLWLQKLNQMRASDELEDEEARQLSLDLDNLYAAFMDHLTKSGARK